MKTADESLSLSPWDLLASPTLRHGIGCFETLRLEPGNKIILLEDHIKRLLRGAEICELPLLKALEVRASLCGFLQDKQFDRPMLLRILYCLEAGLTFHLEALAAKADMGQSVKLLTERNFSVNSTSPLNSFKSFNYLANYLSWRSAQRHGLSDAMMFNERGCVVGCSRGNSFFLDDKRGWITPPPEAGCLPGITRSWLIQRLDVSPCSITYEELANFKAGLYTNSVRGICYIESIDDVEYELGDLAGELNTELISIAENL